MTNPTTLVSAFSTDLSATDRSGPTAWTEATSSAVTFSDTQMQLDDGDAVWMASLAYLDSSKGSVSFHFTRHTDTGGDEYLLEYGQDGADWLRIYTDGATDTLVLWWSSGGGTPTTLQSAQTIALDTRYSVTCGWQHTATSMAIGTVGDFGIVDSRVTVTGTRDAPVGEWGTSKLTILAAAPGAEYGVGAYGAGLYGA